MQDAFRKPTTDEVSLYRENGWVVLRDAVPLSVVERLLHVAQAAMGEEADRAPYSERGSRYSAWSNASQDNETLRRLSQSRELGIIPSTLLRGRQLRWYNDSFIAKRGITGGGTRTPWHQDLPQQAFDRGGATTLWIPLVDCPAEQGTLRFLSGSHRAGPMGRFGRRADGSVRTEDIVDVYPSVLGEFELSPSLDLCVGDATAHDALTAHSAPDNSTESVRWVYAVTWFPAETLYTGADSYHTNGLGLRIDWPFDNERFPIIPVAGESFTGATSA